MRTTIGCATCRPHPHPNNGWVWSETELNTLGPCPGCNADAPDPHTRVEEERRVEEEDRVRKEERAQREREDLLGDRAKENDERLWWKD